MQHKVCKCNFKRQIWILWIMMPLVCSGTYYGSNDNDNYIDSENPTLIRESIGSSIQLPCGIYNYHTDYMTMSNVHWDFKANGIGYSQPAYRNYSDSSDGWLPVNCDQKVCKATLQIHNLTEFDSGLYRCSIQPYKPNNQTTLEIQVIKTYQLNVINLTVSLPELIGDLPANITVPLRSQVVLQCRVFSRITPSIKWFRRQNNVLPIPFAFDDTNYSSHAIRYIENFYKLLESSGEKSLSDNTYLSKIIINNVSEKDAGFYACVGINYRGFKIREAYLSVEEQDDDNATDPSELLLLFLIPIGLACCPISLWICYVINRSYCRNDRLPTSDEQRNNINVKSRHVDNNEYFAVRVL